MKKIITKIEGEATLKIKGDKFIEFAEIEFWQYRGIENYLINKNYMDALVINPRICGICGHSHLIATTQAIENAFDANISQKANIIRKITLNLEIIENHIKWFYITLFPTQIKDKKYLFKALKFAQKISKSIALIAGQYPHNSYSVPGGITSDFTNLDLIKLKNLLLEIFEDYEKEIITLEGKSKDLELFFENIPQNIGQSLNKFLKAEEVNISEIKENQTSSKFQNVTYKNNFYEVGPLARMLDNTNVANIYKKYKDSIYTRIFARIYEGIIKLDTIIKLIDKIDINEPSYIKPNITSNIGISIIEAPRGILIHKIEILHEKIKNYNIIVPTQFNLSNGTKENPSPAQKALIGENKKYIDTIFKCFDICAVCMTH